jgi:hypothetical protein
MAGVPAAATTTTTEAQVGGDLIVLCFP